MGLKRISSDKAKNLIKATEDYTDSPIKYYTITPSTSDQFTRRRMGRCYLLYGEI